ncbi:MAG: ATP-binding protein [Bacteroidetes bacterium]|nr:ATP-binding protein [Bacteroidota bacterium]
MSENLNREYKSSFTDAVIETLTAFANTKGGEIWVGVDNTGIPISGFAIGSESVQQYINEIPIPTCRDKPKMNRWVFHQTIKK